MSHDTKIKALDDRIAALQKEKTIIILEKEIEVLKNQIVIQRTIYQDVYVPRIVQYPQYPQWNIVGGGISAGGQAGQVCASGTNNLALLNSGFEKLIYAK